MRSSKQRSRSKSNRPRTLGNIVNRVFDSSGPEGKVRGTPQQIIDKYLVLARDAQLSNDRVAAEAFLQHAEHYTRMLGEAQREQDARRDQQGGPQGDQDGPGANGQHHQPQGGGERGQDAGQRNGGGGNGGGNGNGNAGDRGERQDRGGRNGGPRPERAGDRDGDQPRPTREAGRSALDEVIDVDDNGGGLVETPESASPAPSSAPAEDRDGNAPPPAAGDGTASPAEDGDKPAKPRRKPAARKPRAKAPRAKGGDGGDDDKGADGKGEPPASAAE